MYKFLSGAKSVKKYRGDENLPEAKKGMKNCGCKHPKTKYKYGAGALPIPENSAIVTANDGKNKLALEAYADKDWEKLNGIIESMPEDKVSKKKDGDPKTLPLFDEKKGMKNKRLRSSEALSEVPKDQHKSGNLYGKVTQEQFEQLKKNNPWYDWTNFDPSKKGDVRKFQEEFNKTSEKLGSSARLEVDDKLGEQTATAKVDYTGDIPEDPNKQGNTGKTQEDIFATDKKKGNFLSNIPSMAEISARGSILGRGIEGVPENYLALGRYKYASQLPKTLQEIQLAEQAGRESARDIVAGDAGRYLAQAGSLSAARMKAAGDAVIQDTLARQDIANKNVDLGNVESQTNLGLKNQYAQQRAMGRAAYDQQLIGLGQRIDSATETAQEMANQRSADDQRMQLLKDLGQNYQYQNVNGLMKLVPKVPTNTPPTTSTDDTDATSKKGLKRLKTYKKK